MNWSFYQIWNKSLEQENKKTYEPRESIWASELGGALVDRFWKMKGVAPSNPPDARSLRKFEAGNVMEWIVGLVLQRAGILQSSRQRRVQYQYPDLYPVIGRLDFIAGGKPDWERALNNVANLNVPDFFNRALEAIIDHFRTSYPDGLKEAVLEIKSCSSFMWDKYEKYGAEKHHTLQLYHYLKGTGIPEGHLVYIAKDDLRLLEVGVLLNTPELEELYYQDVLHITNYLKHNETPPPEPELIFDYDKITTNWKVAYSPYLTKIYGYKDPADFETRWTQKLARWNRTIGRHNRGDKITKLNKKSLEEIEKQHPKIYEKITQEKL